MSAPSEPRFAPVFPSPLQPVVIAGAGVIGLSTALELHRRGIGVSVVDPQTAGPHNARGQASVAAAGMLAAEDPHNPLQLGEIARYSRSLYPDFLEHLETLSGCPVPMQTTTTVQYAAGRSPLRLEENSIDPRQLAAALLEAAKASGIDLRLGTVPEEAELAGRTVVVASGAWAGTAGFPVAPRKGQMLRITLTGSLAALREVYRSERVYIVPRLYGPQAGSALIGATVEDAGFDVTTHADDLAALRAAAAEMLPALADQHGAPMVECWAGLRPYTPDALPVLGRSGDRVFAAGHYRNGILLAPATAVIVADTMEGKLPAVDIGAFSPQRFAR